MCRQRYSSLPRIIPINHDAHFGAFLRGHTHRCVWRTVIFLYRSREACCTFFHIYSCHLRRLWASMHSMAQTLAFSKPVPCDPALRFFPLLLRNCSINAMLTSEWNTSLGWRPGTGWGVLARALLCIQWQALSPPGRSHAHSCLQWVAPSPGPVHCKVTLVWGAWQSTLRISPDRSSHRYKIFVMKIFIFETKSREYITIQIFCTFSSTLIVSPFESV